MKTNCVSRGTSKLALASLVFMLSAACTAQGAYLGLGRTDSASPTGSQSFGGSLGEDFSTGATSISVTKLGVFDSGGATISSMAPPSVEIINNVSHAVVAGPISISSSTPGATLTDGYLFAALASPVTLAANTSYRIIGYGLSLNGNVNSGDPAPVGDPNGSGLISFPSTGTGSNGGPSEPTNSYYNLTAGSNPNVADAGTGSYVPNLYSAGSFQFVAVPEPSSFVLCGVAAAGLMLAARRRRKA